jgi:hypothetical protein
MSCGLGRLRKGVFQDFQLFGLDCGARTTTFRSRSAFVRRLGFGRVIATALSFAIAINRTFAFEISNFYIIIIIIIAV